MIAKCVLVTAVVIAGALPTACGAMVHVETEQALREALDAGAAATLAVRAAGGLEASGRADAALQQVRSDLYTELIGQRIVAAIMPDETGARYRFDIEMIIGGEGSAGVRAGRDEVALDVRIVDLTDGRTLASFVSRGRSAVPLLAPGNEMGDAIDQAVLGVLRTIER